MQQWLPQNYLSLPLKLWDQRHVPLCLGKFPFIATFCIYYFLVQSTCLVNICLMTKQTNELAGTGLKSSILSSNFRSFPMYLTFLSTRDAYLQISIFELCPRHGIIQLGGSSQNRTIFGSLQQWGIPRGKVIKPQIIIIRCFLLLFCFSFLLAFAL